MQAACKTAFLSTNLPAFGLISDAKLGANVLIPAKEAEAALPIIQAKATEDSPERGMWQNLQARLSGKPVENKAPAERKAPKVRTFTGKVSSPTRTNSAIPLHLPADYKLVDQARYDHFMLSRGGGMHDQRGLEKSLRMKSAETLASIGLERAQ